MEFEFELTCSSCTGGNSRASAPHCQVNGSASCTRPPELRTAGSHFHWSDDRLGSSLPNAMPIGSREAFVRAYRGEAELDSVHRAVRDGDGDFLALPGCNATPGARSAALKLAKSGRGENHASQASQR